MEKIYFEQNSLTKVLKKQFKLKSFYFSKWEIYAWQQFIDFISNIKPDL